MKTPISKNWLFAITGIWLVLLALLSFVFEVSQTTLLIAYVTGQGFILALWVPYWARQRKNQTCD